MINTETISEASDTSDEEEQLDNRLTTNKTAKQPVNVMTNSLNYLQVIDNNNITTNDDNNRSDNNWIKNIFKNKWLFIVIALTIICVITIRVLNQFDIVNSYFLKIFYFSFFLFCYSLLLFLLFFLLFIALLLFFQNF